MAWFERLYRHAATFIDAGHPAVLAGDFNVVPTDADIYSTGSWRDNALLQPEARAAFHRLEIQGWTDALKPREGERSSYTFWSYLRNRWSRDAGLRIDHLLVSKTLVARLTSAGVDKPMRGLEGTSDHAPAWIELKGFA